MSAVVIGMAVMGGVAGGALGFTASLMAAFGAAFGGGGGNHSLLKPTLAGVFLGAAIGGGAGWAIDGGVSRYMHDVGERAVINDCLKRIDRGEAVVIGRNARGETSCIPAPQI